ncbi:MAG: homoserine dehydrogenase [Clostridia bacterium]|nr:homoserine dehydrogenase [Clostridia bacterium]MDD4571031.1 homoserine dehydrogenase [Clostridia bacterium]
MKKEINVGIIGLGTVGGGTAKVLVQNKELICSRAASIKLAKVYDRYGDYAREKVAELGLPESIVCSDVKEITYADDIDVVVELIGGIHPAKEIIIGALNHGKSVVTANKDLIASHGLELFEIAEKNGADLLFEASVAGGIPIIRALKESLAANNVNLIMGIVNGTTNYILTQMSASGADFAPSLKQAQELGYAEADPTNDVDGFDAARKMAILASIAFNSSITEKMVYVEGIRSITKFDIAYAKQFGYTVKLVGIAKADGEDVEVRVHPLLITEDHPLASVNDVFNAVFLEGDALGKAMFYGRGAGELPTASAVVSDIIVTAQHIQNGTRGLSKCSFFSKRKIKPMSEVVSKYYLRLMVLDEPRVLAQIASVIGENKVSIDAVIQKRIIDSGLAEIVLVTHEVKEAYMQSAIEALDALSCVDSVASIIRVDNSTKQDGGTVNV